ncbi:MAG: hypothetical protein GY906_22865 [bacterium]|nr:hypothetical protein [bacterium]
MARKQTAAQRRASLRNLKKARAARGPTRRRRTTKRRRNPPRAAARRASPKRRRSTAWRTKAPARRRYGYSKSRRRVVRTNQPRFLRGFQARTVKAVTDAAWAIGGKALVNSAAGFLPFPRDGLMGTGVKLLTAFAVTGVARNFKVVGANGAHMMLVGSVMGMLEPYAKMIPIVGPALGEDLPLGAYLGAYESGNMGEINLPLGESGYEEDMYAGVGEYQFI